MFLFLLIFLKFFCLSLSTSFFYPFCSVSFSLSFPLPPSVSLFLLAYHNTYNLSVCSVSFRQPWPRGACLSRGSAPSHWQSRTLPDGGQGSRRTGRLWFYFGSFDSKKNEMTKQTDPWMDEQLAPQNREFKGSLLDDDCMLQIHSHSTCTAYTFTKSVQMPSMLLNII